MGADQVLSNPIMAPSHGIDDIVLLTLSKLKHIQGVAILLFVSIIM